MKIQHGVVYQTLNECGLTLTSPIDRFWALTHVSAICRKYNYKFITKAEANKLGIPNSATWYNAMMNMQASTHVEDIQQEDRDLANAVDCFWLNRKGPDYLQGALKIKGMIDVQKQLPTLALLVYEYLKQLNQFYAMWNIGYEFKKSTKKNPCKEAPLNCEWQVPEYNASDDDLTW